MKTNQIIFSGKVLERGFWLYIWEIATNSDEKLFYVGRTGDSSSNNAQSPYNRMSQHLGYVESSNMLRKHLEKKDVNPNECKFKLVSVGPIFEEAPKDGMDIHRIRRDKMAAMEKKLAEDMCQSGYAVMNTVNCKKKLDKRIYESVLIEFKKHFGKLKSHKEITT